MLEVKEKKIRNIIVSVEAICFACENSAVLILARLAERELS